MKYDRLTLDQPKYKDEKKLDIVECWFWYSPQFFKLFYKNSGKQTIGVEFDLLPKQHTITWNWV